MPRIFRRGERVKTKGSGSGTVQNSNSRFTSIKSDKSGRTTVEKTENVEPEKPK
jgi:hypothetical protein